jgi:hypothetical protein
VVPEPKPRDSTELCQLEATRLFDAGHDPNLTGFMRNANYYRAVWHDVNYVACEWSRFFKVVEHFPGMLHLYQDLVILVRE